MKVLIAEDDFTNRLLLQEFLKEYGTVHTAVNGREVIVAFSTALAQNEPYDLLCLDILMPEMDGHQALAQVRRIEEEAGRTSQPVKILMTTGLSDSASVIKAFREQCDSYLTKPIDRAKLHATLIELGLVV
jgi:two-component system, chemotaxis family, chemotaxis protein CheY